MNPFHLSDQLKQTRNRLADSRHGGLVLTGEELEETIACFNQFIAAAKQMEQELDRLQWNSKAQSDLRSLVNGHSAVILDAMRSGDSKVVRFPNRSGHPADPSKSF